MGPPLREGWAMKWIQRFALLGALALIAAGCNVDWAQFRADTAHSGTQTESKISTSNVATMLPKWTTAVGNAILGSPAVASNVAYVATYDGKVAAALYYAKNVLPGVDHKAKLMADEDKSPLEIGDASFATV